MKSYKEPARIESKTVRDFCEDGLSKYYFTPVQQNLLERRKSGLLDLVGAFYRLTVSKISVIKLHLTDVAM